MKRPMKDRAKKPASPRAAITILAAGALLGFGALLASQWLAAPLAASVSIGGPFSLTDGAGKTVTDADFRGKWMLVYFGYTHCPDACPTALADIASAMDKLPPAGRDAIVPVFVTVDPARDTPTVMRDYSTAFGPSFVGLTGSPAAISGAERAYRVYAAKHDLANGDYVMDHSSIIYVMDPKGRFITDFTRSDPAAMAAKLQQLGA